MGVVAPAFDAPTLQCASMGITRDDSGHSAGQTVDLNGKGSVQHPGAVAELAIEVRPPAAGGSLSVDRAGVIGSRGNGLHAWINLHIDRRRAGGFRAITELTAGVAPPTLHGS